MVDPARPEPLLGDPKAVARLAEHFSTGTRTPRSGPRSASTSHARVTHDGDRAHDLDPGVSAGTTICDARRCDAASGSETAITIPNAAPSAPDENHLCPSITSSSPAAIAPAAPELARPARRRPPPAAASSAPRSSCSPPRRANRPRGGRDHPGRRRPGGYVVSSQVSLGSGGEFELRVPERRLQRALARLSGIGKVRERTQNSQDITAAVVSVRERLKDARTERRSLLKQLARRRHDEPDHEHPRAPAPRLAPRSRARSATSAGRRRARPTRRSASRSSPIARPAARSAATTTGAPATP